MIYRIRLRSGVVMKKQDGPAEFESVEAAREYLKSLGVSDDKIADHYVIEPAK